MSRFEVQFVDRNREALIQRVTSVVPIADELKDRNMINDEKYAEFNAEKVYQGKMRVLFEALDSGGDRVKIEFYYTLKLYQPFLFKDLGGVTTENEWELNDEKAASYVDKHRSELIQRVQRVMAVTRKLLTMNMINVETYSMIWRAGNKQDRMRTLYVALDEGGNEVKSAFYSALKECESHLCYLDRQRLFSSVRACFMDITPYLERKYNSFFDSNRSELIQRVTAVIPIVDGLLKQHKLNDQTFAQIRREPTNQEQMTKLFKALDKGGYDVKSAFYFALRKYEPHLLCYLENKPSILQYKSSVIDSCKFVTEYNLPSNERVELDRRYTEPVIIQRSKEQNEKYYREHLKSVDASCQLLSNDKNHSVTLDQLFSPDSDGNTPKTVILTGDSGRGKSFTLQKIMLDWATGKLYSENFDVIFLLKSDELKFITEEKSLSELLSWSFSLTSKNTSEILELTPDKILILIDGIDDFSFDPHIHISQSHKALPMDLVMGLLNGRILSESFLLVTLRTAADAVMNHLKGPQRFTEIVGFSERGVQEYFQKFVQDEQLFGKTYECVKTNESLLTTCSVPLLCWMVCFCLKKHFKDNDHVMPELKTTTSIYVHFVSTLLEHHGQSQSVLTMLRSLGQLAEEGILDEEVLFDIKTVLETFEGQNDQFLHEELWIRECRTIRVHKFMHLSFQEFFVALYFIFLNEETSQRNIRDTLAAERVKGRLSNPISSVLLFLCGLSNEDASSSLFKMHNWTVPYIIRKEMESIILTLLDEDQLFALRRLYELHDEEFVRRALGDRVSMDLCNISLRSTDCWVLLYCLQCCPHIRGLNLMYCDLTADKLKILQPALCTCETLRFSVEHLSGDLIKILGESKMMRELKVQEDEYSAESSRWSLDLSVTCENVFLSLSSSEKNPSFPAVLNISLTCSHSGISSIDWTLFLQTLSKAGKLAEDSSPLEDYVSLLLSSFHTVGLKTLDLKLFSLNESWASGIISLVQTSTSLQQLSVCGGLLLEEGLVSLKESLSDPHCTVIIEGWKCSKPTEKCTDEDLSQNCNEKVKIHFKPNILLNITEPSALDLHPLPVCRSCVHIVDCDQWVQVEPSVCTDEGGSKFRISTRAGRFECSRTRMRWVCAGDVTLQYREVDGRFLSAELESLQCERIGPVIDVTVISGKLEEAHLPHYACLAESDPSLKDAVKLLSVENEGITLESVELTRFHARILQPYFSPKTVLMKLGISVKVHCDLLVFMTKNNPIILHVYFFPSDSVVAKKIKTEEKLSHQIKCPRPETPLRMTKQHSLDVPGASVQPKEIKLRGDFKPNFFQVRQSVVDDINMTLSRVNDQKSVWTATIWKELTNINPSKAESSCFLNVQKHETPQVAVHFDKAQFFDRNWCDFIKIIKNVKAVADKLLQKQFIHEEIYSEITHPNSTSEESMRKICSIVRKGSVAVKNFLISVLLEENPNLLNQLSLSDS